jgi:4-hydroxybenzoate polyprenyltransferase
LAEFPKLSTSLAQPSLALDESAISRGLGLAAAGSLAEAAAAPDPGPAEAEPDGSAGPGAPRRSRLPPFLAALRPHQWIKNLFVGAPLLFAKRLLDPVSLGRAALAVAVFCALSGAVYLINDIADVERDRAHPKKRHRAIASGALPIRTARLGAVALAAVALLVAFLTHVGFGLVAAGYFTLNLFYSFGLKKLAYVDAAVIASGFLLRVYGGSLAIDVPVSVWLIACTFSLALFLALGKRRHELASAADAGTAKKQRSALAAYKESHLGVAMWLVGAATAVAYTLYTLAPMTQRHFGTRWLVATVPLIVFGIYRFTWLVGQHARSESPTEEMLRDIPFVVNIVLWVMVIVGLIYGGRFI